jgi:hypothetical protein
MALIHRWTFNGHWRDDIGNKEAYPLSGAKLNLQQSSIYGPYMLDANNSSGDGAYTDSLTLTDEFTISFWVRKDSWSTWRYLVGNADYDTDGFAIMVDSTNKIRFTSDNGTTLYQAISDTVTLDTTESNHIVVTCDRSTGDNVKIYVNGEDVSNTDDDCATDFNLTGPLYFTQGPGPSSQLYGYMDDIQIYDEVLSSSECLWLYYNPGGYVGEVITEIIPIYRWRWEYHAPPGSGYYYNDYISYVPGYVGGSATQNSTYEVEGERCLSTNAANSFFQTNRQIGLRGGKFSVGLWWKVFGGSGKHTMVGNLDSMGDNAGWRINYDYANTRIEVMTSDGTNTSYAYSDAPTYVSGTAYHFGVSFDRDSGTVEIFQDGVDITSTDDDCETDFPVNGDIRAGLDFDSGGDAYGYQDDLVIFSGYLDATAWTYMADNSGHIWLQEFQEDRYLLGHWTLENSWEDVANGLAMLDLADAGATFVDDTTYNIPFGTYALDLDGTNQSVQLTHLPLKMTNWSFSFWVYFDTLSTGTFQHIFGSYGFEDSMFNGTTYDGGIWITCYDPSDLLQVRLYYTVDSYYTCNTASSAISVSTWYHVVVTYDHSAEETKIYLNGSNATSSDNTGSEYIKAASQFQIGSRWYGINYRMNGKLKDIQIYNVTLDSTEVSWLYNNPGEEISYTTTIYGTGTITSDSTVTGALTGRGSVSGTISTDSTVIGDLSGTGSISGTVSTDSTVTGDLTIDTWRKFISGTITASSSTTAHLSGYGLIKGTYTIYNWTTASAHLSGYGLIKGTYTIYNWTTASGDIVGYAHISGTSSGSSALTGILTSSAVSGTITTGTTTTAHLSGFGLITGSILTDSTVTGDLAGTGSISGAVTTDSTVTAHLSTYNPISGTISTGSTVTGSCLNGASIVGQIFTSSTVSGAIVGKTELTVAVSTSSTVSGDLKGSTELEGTVYGTSTVTGVIVGHGYLTTTVTTGSTITGDLRGSVQLSGSITGSSTVSADLSSRTSIHGTIDGSSVITGHLVGTAQINGTADGSSFVTAYVGTGVHKEYIWGTIYGSSTVTGESLRSWRHGSGTITTSSTLSGHLQATVPISGTIITGTTISVNGVTKKYGSGTISGVSGTSGHLSGHYRHLSGSTSGSTSQAGDIIGRGEISVEVSTSTTLSGDLSGVGSISGVITTGSIVSAHFAGIYNISGTITTSSTVTGDCVSKSHGSFISGTASGSTSVSGAIHYAGNTKYISGTIQTATILSGDIIGNWNDLSGTITGSSTVSGDLIMKPNYKSITGTISAGSTVSADLWKRERVKISGDPIYGSTVATADIVGRFPVTVTILTGSTVYGDINATAIFGGTIYTSSTVSGHLRAVVPISGTITTGSSISGYLQSMGPLSGSISGSTLATGTISARGELSGAITTGTSTTTHLSAIGLISGSTTGLSAVTGHVQSKGPVSGTVLTSTTISGALTAKTHVENISGVSSGSSTVSGNVIHRYSDLGVRIITGTTVRGKLQAKVPISGSTDSHSSISGTLKGRTALSVTVVTSSEISANLGATGMLGGTTVSRSIVEGILRAVGREWNPIFAVLTEDRIKCSILEPELDGLIRWEEFRMVLPDKDVEILITDEAIRMSATEDTVEGIIVDEDSNMVM